MAKAKSNVDVEQVGHYSFIVGILLAVIVGLVPSLRGDLSIIIMLVLGVVVGLLNITAREVSVFLIASVALIMASSVGATAFRAVPSIGEYLTAILGNILIFVAPAAIIVALKAIYALAEGR